MRPRLLLQRLLSSLPAAMCGCFTAEFDPTASGVFACAVDPECPEEMACINQRCEAGTPPVVAIGFPEDEQPLTLDGLEIGAQRELTMTMSGTLDLTAPGGDHVFGEGHIEVTVDGDVVGEVTSGPLSGVLDFPITIANTVGPHRIGLRAMRNDGEPYDHAGAVARRLFWITDGVTPLVGIKQPWPGASFELEDAQADIEAAVLDFTLQAANNAGPIASKTGHVHIYYDKDLPTCLADVDGCDKEYLATIVGAGMVTTIALPDSSARRFDLSVVLRNIDHSLYLFPEDGTGVAITDTIEIERE